MPALRVYVGCRTTAERNARGQGIAMYEVAADGTWALSHITPAGDNPSYLCLHPNGRVLYTVHGDRDAVSAFAVNPGDGTLQALGTWPVQGRNPVHLAVSPGGRWLVVACYATGNVSALPLQRDGLPGPVASVLRFPGAPGPRAEQQKGAHPHQVVFDPSGRWLLVPDKGVDAVSVLRLDEVSGALSFAGTTGFSPGSGPRHLVFHPRLPLIYLACELGSEVCACGFDASNGRIDVLQTLPTVAAEASAGNTAAGIAIDAPGRRLYVSNRGSDSVASFGIDAATGLLAPQGARSSGGRTPRFIAMAPDGSTVLAANEDGDSIVAVSPDSSSPTLLARTGSPVCLLFSKDLK